MTTFSVPARVADSLENRRRAEAARHTQPCGEGADGSTCGQYGAHLYPRGWRCEQHAPGPQVVPDPTRTLAGLREAARHEHTTKEP